jgi:thioredoxin 1
MSPPNDVKTLNILAGALLVIVAIVCLSLNRGKQLDANELPEGSLKRMVLESDVPVLVDFSADWCGACRALSPILAEFESRNSDVKVVRVNIDKNRELAEYFQIRAIPTLMVFKNGKMTARQTGVANQMALQKMVGQ